ncbi:MAG: TIGR01621 family pseudouridine synthase [Litorilituus sp.]|jgi:tRNA pseudouridine32 synthase/23S rRNA pseudouridine746 synthase|nr:TIGR01621 family pseudouridine synthase [Litorilituus sp.]
MFKIITQTPDFIVIAKAPDVNFHDEGKIGEGLFSQVKSYVLSQSICQTLYPVHRLDKMTSGLLLFATNLTSAQIFNDLFKNHQIDKYYLAISDKKPNKKQGLIKGDMEKSRRGMFKLMRTLQKPAITQFFSYSIGEGKRLYLLKPHSGKTHQLRVALSSIGAPILGDPLYYPKPHQRNIAQQRGYLHAYALRFYYQNELFELTSFPAEGKLFLQAATTKQLQAIKKPWSLSWPNVSA